MARHRHRRPILKAPTTRPLYSSVDHGHPIALSSGCLVARQPRRVGRTRRSLSESQSRCARRAGRATSARLQPDWLALACHSRRTRGSGALAIANHRRSRRRTSDQTAVWLVGRRADPSGDRLARSSGRPRDAGCARQCERGAAVGFGGTGPVAPRGPASRSKARVRVRRRHSSAAEGHDSVGGIREPTRAPRRPASRSLPLS